MGKESFIEKISAGLSQSANIKNVFGEPVQAGEKTIIPVAKITYGFGGGFEEGNKKEVGQEDGETSGGGGGGGMYASAKGVFEITPTCTRFIPASPTKHILVGVVIGMLLKSFLKRR
jgi:uncharacterized spore protein YtfJ